jgi:hypothetical protein
MHCPVVQLAVVWLQDLWARLVPAWQPAASGRQGADCWSPHCVGPGRGGCWVGAVGPSATALASFCRAIQLALAAVQGGQWSGFHSRCSGCADGGLDCEGCSA